MFRSLTQRDLEVIWHPYTQHKNMIPPVPIVRASGALLYDETGNGYVDAISSWWVNLHGHAHPFIAEKIYEQAQKLEHVIFTGFTHEPAVLLAERLLAILPGTFSKVFYSDNGSTAVEVAIKMAIQYWKNMEKTNGKKTRRKKILAFNHAYHGDTFGAMSVSSRSAFTQSFTDYLFEVAFIDPPTNENIDELKSFIQNDSDEIACIIYEPLLQAAGGMLIYEAACLDSLLEAAKSFDIIRIADEVLTGFGRTGKLFAGDYLRSKADIVCLSKGLTGGTMAMGVTACTAKIFNAFFDDDRSKTFFHGHSFTANPIACAAALASLDLLEREDCKERIDKIGARHSAFVKEFNRVQPHEAERVRQLGTVLAFDLKDIETGYMSQLSKMVTANAMRNGIYLRPLGNTVYIMPPYCIEDQQLDKLYDYLSSLPTEFNHSK
ncbi:MAG: adenosylmethionine--8-amino-7-oxononanoate transaminase [Bacteroidetes bacterium]|nr:MAG: adenosylmethionine--8-amino-7-oxononanoate transaminase [Bacteroidota bacterium]